MWNKTGFCSESRTNGYWKIGENEKVACDNTSDNGCHSITFRETDNFPFSQCVVFCLLPIKEKKNLLPCRLKLNFSQFLLSVLLVKSRTICRGSLVLVLSPNVSNLRIVLELQVTGQQPCKPLIKAGKISSSRKVATFHTANFLPEYSSDLKCESMKKIVNRYIDTCLWF